MSSEWTKRITPSRFSARQTGVLLVVLLFAILVLGVLYQLGMRYLEGDPRGFIRSLEWASETITTTGYGADSRWNSVAMNLFVIATQCLGFLLSMLIVPVYILPYLDQRFESRLPRTLPEMDGRVLFYRYGPAVDSMVEELRRARVPFVILEEDDAIARKLRDREYDVVFGTLDEQADLLAGVQAARALVTNADDHSDATFIMMAREQRFVGPILALAEDPLHRGPMLKIGATVVFTPTHVLGAALAARASTKISPHMEGMQILGEYVGIAEFRVQARSPLANQRLRDLHMREEHGVTIIGQWDGGHFSLIGSADTRIAPGAILVAVGAHANLVKVEHLATPIRRHGSIVIAGYGAVGRKVAEMLRDAGETTMVIDEIAAPGVNVVGNVLERTTLEQAKVREASAVVLALSNDSACVFATAVVRDYAPDVPLIARANRAPNVARLHQAGADFALSVGQVAGQILAHYLLGEDTITVEQRIKCTRLAAGGLAGTHPWHTSVGARTGGAAIVAVERGETVFVEFTPDFQIRKDDVVFVCGTRANLDNFVREFGSSPQNEQNPI